MAGKNVPGPMCVHSKRHWLDPVNDGTMCRQPSPKPGIIGSQISREEQSESLPGHTDDAIIVRGNLDDKSTIESWLNKVRGTAIGSRLLKSIDNSGDTVFIRFGDAKERIGTVRHLKHTEAEFERGPERKAARKKLYDGSGTSALMILDFGLKTKSVWYMTKDGKYAQAPGDVVLFHELVHADNIVNGVVRNDMEIEEHNALEKTNEYHRERQPPLPERELTYKPKSIGYEKPK